jgi:hypothetical protein
MPTYTVNRVSLFSDNATEVDPFGWNFFSGTIPANFKQEIKLGDLGLYGIPFPRVTRSTSDPLKTTFPFTP